MIPWAEVHEHDPANLTLLCASHHQEKTVGLLPLETVSTANASPYNVQRSVTAPYGLHFSQSDKVEIRMGSVTFQSSKADMCPIMVDDLPLLSFYRTEDGLGLFMMHFDQYNYPVLEVVDNRLVVGGTNWDVTFIGQRLTIREAARRVTLRIKFEPPARVIIEQARLRYNGVAIDIDRRRMSVGGFTFEKVGFSDFDIGIRVGPQARVAPSSSIHLNVNRYEHSEVAQMLMPGGRDPLMRPLYEADFGQT
jgi:trigger factor